jgi:hypothetical protein
MRLSECTMARSFFVAILCGLRRLKSLDEYAVVVATMFVGLWHLDIPGSSRRVIRRLSRQYRNGLNTCVGGFTGAG